MHEKAADYMSLPSLQAYLVASQDEPIVWLWRRGPEGWPAAPEMIEGRNGAVEILGVKLELGAIYRGIGRETEA